MYIIAMFAEGSAYLSQITPILNGEFRAVRVFRVAKFCYALQGALSRQPSVG